jgi:hypothetical protein
LRNETFFRFNRFYLTITLLISIVLPLFPLRYEVTVTPEKPQPIISIINDNFQSFPEPLHAEAQAANWQEALWILYVSVAVILFLRLAIQLLAISRLVLSCQIKKIDGLKIVENEKYKVPFSYVNNFY